LRKSAVNNAVMVDYPYRRAFCVVGHESGMSYTTMRFQMWTIGYTSPNLGLHALYETSPIVREIFMDGKRILRPR
jgi:hypothetical protein